MLNLFFILYHFLLIFTAYSYNWFIWISNNRKTATPFHK